VYVQLKEAASADLSKTLDQVGWPKKDLRIDSRTNARWTEQVNVLLDLQEPDLKSQYFKLQDEPSTTESLVLLPLEVMVRPLQLRFRYHFYGNRPTNRLDKPEYFLSHIIDLLEDHNAFLLDYLQPILDARSLSLPDLDGMYPDATSVFISALLPTVEAKILTLLPQIRSQAQLLSHFMHELMSFDTALRDSWAFTPVSQSLSDWRGLTWTVLVTHNYFNTWLTVEKNFALSRYESIISAPDSRDIDYESTESGTTKPTKSAIRVNDLLETITDRYRSLSSFSQKLRFLIEIQLEVFDQYHQRLHGSLERYIIDTSTLGKVIQGSSSAGNEARNKSDVHGIYGLESLCKVFGNAEYLERKMSDWSDDIFFLELWDELQDRARRSNGTDGSVGRNLTTSEVALRTSATINPKNDINGAETDEGALFDETASAYRRLRLKAEEQINDLLVNAITTSLRSYSKVSGWSSLSLGDVTNTTTTNSSLAPTPALEATLQLLSDFLSFLFKVLAPAPLRRITRHLCLAMQKYIWDNVLMRNTFSASGTQQLRADVDAIKTVVDSCIKYPGEEGSSRAMRRLDEGIRLLGLPIKPSEGSTTRKMSGEEEELQVVEEGWGFDDEADPAEVPVSAADNRHRGEGGGEYLPADEDKVWSLWEVEKRVFSSNESARSVLADLCIETLNESDARALLGRRIEVGS
jgi:RAD50-interacting protein 1